jgi:hypothetical protein
MTVWCVGSSKSPVYVKNTLEEESPLSSDIISLTGGLVDLDKPFRYLYRITDPIVSEYSFL